jgi:hypothetical protein
VDYPENVYLKVNGKDCDIKNPYSLIKHHYPVAFEGRRTDHFAVQILNKIKLEATTEIKLENQIL